MQFKYRRKRLRIDRKAMVKRCTFGTDNRVYANALLVEVSLGDYSYVSEFSNLYRVTVGKYCAIGPNVLINPGKHPTRDYVSIHPIVYSQSNSACIRPIADRDYFDEHGQVHIGHDVWIGANAIILDGVRIGNGAIVGAGSVVNIDVPSYGIVAGVPAKLVRHRFDEKQIKFLETFKWWDKDRDWLKRNFKRLHHIDRLMASETDQRHASG